MAGGTGCRWFTPTTPIEPGSRGRRSSKRWILDTGEAVLNVQRDGLGGADSEATRRWLSSYYPIRQHDEIIGIGIVVNEITERKHAEESMRFQAALLAAAGQALVAIDLEHVVIYWNKAAEDLYGWSAAEAIGRNSLELFGVDDAQDEANLIFENLSRGLSWSDDRDLMRRDGSTVSVYAITTPMFGEDGGLAAVIVASVDVSARKTAEDSLRQLSVIVEGSGDAIYGSTIKGIITSWNGAAERLFGYTPEEIIGQPVLVLIPPEHLAVWIDVRARLRAGGPHERLETIIRRKDGSFVEVLVTASTTKDGNDNIAGLSVIAQDITDRLSVQRALQASQQRLAEAQRTAGLGSFEFDVATGEMTWSDEYYRIMGIDLDCRPSRALIVSMVHPDDLPTLAQAWLDAVERGLAFDVEHRIVRADSQVRVLRARGVPDKARDGTVTEVAGTLLDDTDRVEANRVRQAAENRFEIGFEQSAIGVVIADLEGIPVRVNPAVCQILGRSEDLLIGRRWTEYTHPNEMPLGRAMLSRVAAGHDTHTDERRYLLPDGAVVWVLAHVTLVRDDAERPLYFFVQLQDVTERKLMEHELAHQALHDSLTGLPNRTLLNDRLAHGLAGSRRRPSHLGVMFLDFDRFKEVNDSWGHATGDDLLRQAAARISAAVRPNDTVARVGGDEFVVVCDEVSPLETEQIAERVLAALSEPWEIGNHEIQMTASVGVAIADADATPESLLRESDAAMYRAKERGRGRVELFDDALRSRNQRRWATVSALHRALERKEFTVHYQPVVDLSTGAMVSVEALLRWAHPTRGLVSPAEFIPMAEETGLIVPIGLWALEQACRQVVEWQTSPNASPAIANLSVAVNLSVRQLLAPDIANQIDGVLTRTGVRPADLCLELTESVFMGDVEYFGTTLAEIKTLGVNLAIDDFGTGYSSLSYLKRFPVDAVKVDRAFVDGLGIDPHDTALVAAIVAMADALGLEVIAEGVESREQLQGLKTLGVLRAQGFYFARPMFAFAISRLVAESHRWKLD